MRLTPLSITKTIIICNIFIFACVQGRKNSETALSSSSSTSSSSSSSSTAISEGETDGDDNNTIRAATNISDYNFNYNDTYNNDILKNNRQNNNQSSSRPSFSLISKEQELKTCPSVHILNDLTQFEALRNCKIIDGPLTIALVTNSTSQQPVKPQDYQNLSFPHLKEIRGYLLLFHVQGLTNLSTLFPNLAVIRGEQLVANYALIIYENMHLQRIDLPNLSDILRGSVRIEGNPNLCHVSTVNWDAICKLKLFDHVIKGNNKRCNNLCPDNCRPRTTRENSTKVTSDLTQFGAENNRTLYCWSNSKCQDFCVLDGGIALPRAPNGDCCSSMCAGGCELGNRSDKCFACRHVNVDGNCSDKCPPDRFVYKQTCLTEKECLEKNHTQKDECGKDIVQSLLAFKSELGSGECLTSCPSNYEEDPSGKKCKLCDKGKCRKVCTNPLGSDKAFMVSNINTLQDLKGCDVINGSLEIFIQGGKNVMQELEDTFKDLQEIKGYLKITRSRPILTLGFLSSLRSINGSELDLGNHSLVIIDNPNLQDLFIFDSKRMESGQKPLNIMNGKVFAYMNPKLCLSRINRLKEYANVAPWDENDVSGHTNGNQELCDLKKLNVTYLDISARVAVIRFENFVASMDDERGLLYYLINYREAPSGNVSMFDGRDGCSSRNNVWTIAEEMPLRTSSKETPAKYQDVTVDDLKPATRYALYVKTFIIMENMPGAISDIIYFETRPDTPSMPRNLDSVATSSETVIFKWSPPAKANGIIKRYLINVKKERDWVDLSNTDACYRDDVRDKLTQKLTQEEPLRPAMIPHTNATSEGLNASRLPTCKSEPEPDAEAAKEEATFQDQVIDYIYRYNICKSPTAGIQRSKRSIDQSQDQTSINVRTNGNEITPDKSERVQNLARGHFVFNRTQDKTTYNFTIEEGTKLEVVIEGLEHFTMYSIGIMACQDYNITMPKEISYRSCSNEVFSQVRTQPIEEMDRVPAESLQYHAVNETLSENAMTWRSPEAPNGMVLAYRVRYRPKAGNPDIWTEWCVNMSDYNLNEGMVLRDINPGEYLFGVQTVSLYGGQRLWTELEFSVEQNYLIPPLVLVFLIIISLTVLLGLVASGTYYYQKKQHELIYASVNPDYMQYEPDEWEIDQKRLIVGNEIGSGSFGKVYKGQLMIEDKTMAVAIKTVPKTSTAKQRMDFLREASIMKQFDTFHVVKLIGVVSVTTPVYVIMEYMEKGDLKDFLRSQRESHERDKKPVVDGIYLMTAQIADGMAYLASKKFVHRDLAARNCMVNEQQVVKIGDFGLTRDVYANDYYRRDTQGRLPVRWMAPESLSDNMYTTASDVWAFGIVVWEIVTFSAYPYQGMSNEEVIKKVIGGYTLPRPDNCPSKLYDIMQKCWRRNDKDRPTFNDIVEYLLPETNDKLMPNCFYRRPQKKVDGDIIARSPVEENLSGTESYPLLSYPSTRANGLSNGIDRHEIDERRQ